MIYDCFTFFNELDLLEMRLNILKDVVDKFVLVEATKTHNGQPKELFYKNNREKFKQFEDKIIHIIVDDFPESKNSWVLENFQRNAISRGLQNCKDDDVIIISDLDEIPNPDKIIQYKDAPGIKAFKMHFFYIYLNNLSNEEWIMPKMLYYKDFKHILDDNNNYHNQLPEEVNHGTTATKIRLLLEQNLLTIIQNGGWHFSYLLNPESISKKIKAFAHQEFNKQEFTSVESIEKRINEGKDLFDRPGYKFHKVKVIKGDYPEYLVKNIAKYERYIMKGATITISGLEKMKKRNRVFAKIICLFCPSKKLRAQVKEYFNKI